MHPFETISKKAAEAGLPYLIIGGYAVMAYGFVRSTGDIDLLVRKSQRDAWHTLIQNLGMTVHGETVAFSQFLPAPGGGMPVDLMFVEDSVFERMQAESQSDNIHGTAVNVVSLLHLIALKCHAFHSGNEGRRFKDIEDLIQLIKLNRINLNDSKVQATILKHGTAELLAKLQIACAPD